jgi:hypothetical protein
VKSILAKLSDCSVDDLGEQLGDQLRIRDTAIMVTNAY